MKNRTLWIGLTVVAVVGLLACGYLKMRGDAIHYWANLEDSDKKDLTGCVLKYGNVSTFGAVMTRRILAWEITSKYREGEFGTGISLDGFEYDFVPLFAPYKD